MVDILRDSQFNQARDIRQSKIRPMNTLTQSDVNWVHTTLIQKSYWIAHKSIPRELVNGDMEWRMASAQVNSVFARTHTNLATKYGK